MPQKQTRSNKLDDLINEVLEASKKAIDEAYDGLAKVPKARISKYYGRIIYNILKAIDNQRSVLDVLYNCKIR